MNITVEKSPSYAYWAPWQGGSWSAGSVAEYLQMLYLNSMDWTKVADVTEDVLIRTLLAPHTWIMDFAWNDALARHYVADLSVHIAATAANILEGIEVPNLQSRSSDKLVFYAGHDSNLVMLRRILRLRYAIRSWNENQYGTGQMLEIELLRANGTGFVRLYETAMSYQSQRAGAVLAPDPVSRVFAIIPGCSDGPENSCPLARFKALILSQVNPECASLIDPAVLLADEDKECNLASNGVHVTIGTMFAIALACLLVGGTAAFFGMRFMKGPASDTNPLSNSCEQPEYDDHARKVDARSRTGRPGLMPL